jgi:N-acetylglucosamine-6-phosphate deacetylase
LENVDPLQGVHLEGPFINKEKKGAHEECCITALSNGMQDVQRVYGNLENVSIITLAPELTGALDVVKQLTASGITVSVGK